ncbi:hypothetical protein QWZ13_17140 [Reinekea marina]|uniref:hypothetical protein n=1 Tax=Reinekea marina TaxID=1310421 RepID=UPI0025B3AC3C|nr:hypothetical protein [Reinekea marina]MDN3650633.1 hypothetical protein [Reinekea marina]
MSEPRVELISSLLPHEHVATIASYLGCISACIIITSIDAATRSLVRHRVLTEH